MILEVLNHTFHYEMENLCRVFYPNQKIVTVRSSTDQEQGTIVSTRIDLIENAACIAVRIRCYDDAYDKQSTASVHDGGLGFWQECERSMAVALFGLLRDRTGYTPRWGILTGVRPSKLMTKLIKETSEADARDYFIERLLVSPQKANLALSVAVAEESLIKTALSDAFSLYVSIPFCPSRCNYCSFVSHSIHTPAAKKMLPAYIDLLCQELKHIGDISSRLKLRPQTVYVGGGTPTGLEPNMLETLLNTLRQNFDVAQLAEFTVEAGRPDTITMEKLQLLKDYGVDRISINPQSFDDAVLQNIGREHNADSVYAAYNMAVRIGFKSINMDLIAGLPGDDTASFEDTLTRACSLEPQNITVHTLAVKRASALSQNNTVLEDGERVVRMLEIASNLLTRHGYAPYYMYRQSKSLGNLENVGWSRVGYECVYNVFMMEECQTVLAAGAGAVTKLNDPETKRLERIFNFKYPYEYIARFGELTERKKRIDSFFTNSMESNKNGR